MSSKQVYQMQLTCDGCGYVFPLLAATVAQTRQLATDDGWRCRTLRYEHRKWTRRVDVCPTCAANETMVIAAVMTADGPRVAR